MLLNLAPVHNYVSGNFEIRNFFFQVQKFPCPRVIGFVADSLFSTLDSGFKISGFAGCVWTEAVSGRKKLRIQKYLDTCGRVMSRGGNDNGFFSDPVNTTPEKFSFKTEVSL